MILGFGGSTFSSSMVVNAPDADKNVNPSMNKIMTSDTLIKILSTNLVNYLNDSASILKITSMIPEVRNSEHADKINSSLHGIANNYDIEKRKIADDVLKYSDNFEAITFLLPNGDMYMEEPYDRQLNLSKNNFAFRDYYKGALETKAAFLGDEIISVATGERVAVISVPIYLEKDQSLVGIWNGVLNIGIFNKMLQSLNLSDGTRTIYVDGNGQKIADSNTLLSDKAESFVNLNSFKNGITGKNGNSIEVINGTKFLITYSPVEILSNTWIVMVMQPA
jgi:hypothetical protein